MEIPTSVALPLPKDTEKKLTYFLSKKGRKVWSGKIARERKPLVKRASKKIEAQPKGLVFFICQSHDLALQTLSSQAALSS